MISLVQRKTNKSLQSETKISEQEKIDSYVIFVSGK